MSSTTYRFHRKPQAYVLVAVFVLCAIGAGAVAVADHKPSYFFSTAFFLAFALFILSSTPVLKGSVLRVGWNRCDLATAGAAAFRAYTVRYYGAFAVNKAVQLVVLRDKGRKFPVSISTPGKLAYRADDFHALSAALRENPALVGVANELDALVSGSNEHRAATYQRLARR